MVVGVAVGESVGAAVLVGALDGAGVFVGAEEGVKVGTNEGAAAVGL